MESLTFLATNCEPFTLRKYELKIALRRILKSKAGSQLDSSLGLHTFDNISLDLYQI